MAVGLGSMDMPVPSVAEWAWLNWKFPRAVHAGETIYARWTLTQKRAPVGGAPTAIVVWRVDVLTAGGALCAEGEVGANVLRNGAIPTARAEEPATAATGPTPRRRRGRRRAPAGDGTKSAADTKAAVPVEAPAAAPAKGAVSPSPSATLERAPGGARRRRRRRSPGSGQARNGDAPAAAPAPTADAPPSPPARIPAPATQKGASQAANPLTRVMRRLRRP